MNSMPTVTLVGVPFLSPPQGGLVAVVGAGRPSIRPVPPGRRLGAQQRQLAMAQLLKLLLSGVITILLPLHSPSLPYIGNCRDDAALCFILAVLPLLLPRGLWEEIRPERRLHSEVDPSVSECDR